MSILDDLLGAGGGAAVGGPVGMGMGLLGAILQGVNSHPASQQFRQSFSNSGATDPINLLSQALGAVNNAEVGLGSVPILSGANYIPPSNRSTSVPGIPFNFGGSGWNPQAPQTPDLSKLFAAYHSLVNNPYANPTAPGGDTTKIPRYQGGIL